MIKKITLFLLIIIFSVIFFLMYLGLEKKNSYSPNLTEKAVVENFSSQEILSNKQINFNDLLNINGFTIVNIWASWCLPCRDEHKYLLELSKINNIQMIGLNYKDKVDNAKDFLNSYKNPFHKVLVDNDGTKSILFGAYGVPETFLIDNSNKKIIKKFIGPINRNNIIEIRNLIK